MRENQIQGNSSNKVIMYTSIAFLTAIGITLTVITLVNKCTNGLIPKEIKMLLGRHDTLLVSIQCATFTAGMVEGMVVIIKMDKQCKSKQEEINSLETEAETRAKQLENMNSTNIDLQHKYDSLQVKTDGQTKQLNILEGQYKKFKDETDMTELTNQNETLTQKISQQDTMIGRLQNQSEKQNRCILELKEHNENIKSMNTRLNAQLETHENHKQRANIASITKFKNPNHQQQHKSFNKPKYRQKNKKT